MGDGDRSEAAARHGWRIVLCAVLIASLYAPLLQARFDFEDDGNLVYPAAPMPLRPRADLVWRKIVANYEDLGPFRPVLWLHWEVQAELLGAHAVSWRLVRLSWMAITAMLYLRLLRELGIRWGPAVCVTALALWNPSRNEFWRSLTLSEGVALPYALGALFCAVRAARSPRPGGWDFAGAACMVAALGCKNTFAAVVPAQLYLRVAAADTIKDWRQLRPALICLSAPLLLPAVHFVVFSFHWHPGQYEVALPNAASAFSMLLAVMRAASLEFVGAGLAFGLFAVVASRPAPVADGNCESARFRAPLRAGLALLVCGIAIYLPMNSVTGRYTVPAVLGADLWMAVFLTHLIEAPAGRWKRAAYIALGGGVAAMMIASVHKQQKFIARAAMLWDALEFIERTAPRGTCLGWVESPNFPVGEGVHFYWHTIARGRQEFAMQFLGSSGPFLRPEVARRCTSPDWLVTGANSSPADETWELAHRSATTYRMGTRTFACAVWRRRDGER